MKCRLCISTVSVMLLLGSFTAGQVPQVINYQGWLTDAEGNPVPDGNYQMTFTIYDAATAGDVKWQEVHPSVMVTNGSFNALLGSIDTPLTETAFIGPDRWLGITIGTDAEITPRTKFGTVPYTFYAINADNDRDWQLISGPDNRVDMYALLADTTLGITPGNVAIGHQNPTAKLDVISDGFQTGYFENNNASFGYALTAEISHEDNMADALLVSTLGKESGAIVANIFNPENDRTVITSYTEGFGCAISAKINNPLNDSAAIFASTNAEEYAGEFVNENPDGGGALLAIIEEETNSDNALEAYTDGTGKAGYFYINNASSDNDVVTAENFGQGAGGRFAGGLFSSNSPTQNGVCGTSYGNNPAAAGVYAKGHGVEAAGQPRAAALGIENGAIRVSGDNKPAGREPFGDGIWHKFESCPTQPMGETHIIGHHTYIDIHNSLIDGSSYILLSPEYPHDDSTVVTTHLVWQIPGQAHVKVGVIGSVYSSNCLLPQTGWIHYMIINHD